MASRNTTIVLIVLACVGLGMLALCGGAVAVLVIGARAAVEFVGEEFEKEMERQAFASSWEPPVSDIAAEELFPPDVAAWQRTSHDEEAEVPEYGIDVAGRRALYEANGRTAEVFAYEVSQLEAEALIRRVAEAIEDQGMGYRSQSGSAETGRYAYTIRPPGETGYLWASQGWLFFARSRDEPDVEPFLMSYLRSVRGAGASAEDRPSVGDASTE